MISPEDEKWITEHMPNIIYMVWLYSAKEITSDKYHALPHDEQQALLDEFQALSDDDVNREVFGWMSETYEL